jgi:hypothetical protein
MKDYLPELYEQVKARVAEGRWEVTASQWVEGDKNLASGEILFRHLLYTRRFFKQEFGLEYDAVTIDWENMPTLYKVYEGSTVIPPGESREFTSAPTRMPNVALRTYECFAGVVAKGTDGVAIEHRYPSTIAAKQLSISPPGVPEVLFFPLFLAAASVGATLLFFRVERAEKWPFLQMVPRWGRHQ